MSRPRVLIIDDERAEQTSRLLRQILREATTSSLPRGEGPWGVTNRHLSLLDVRMPDMDGYGCAAGSRPIHGSRRDPVLFITASDNADSGEPGFRRRAGGLYLKPVCPSTVRAGCAIISPGALDQLEVQLSHRYRHAEQERALQRHRHRGAYLAHGRFYARAWLMRRAGVRAVRSLLGVG